jgi:hypothetical protein
VPARKVLRPEFKIPVESNNNNNKYNIKIDEAKID